MLFIDIQLPGRTSKAGLNMPESVKLPEAAHIRLRGHRKL